MEHLSSLPLEIRAHSQAFKLKVNQKFPHLLDFGINESHHQIADSLARDLSASIVV
jgi:hypothetical protein